MSSTNAPVLTLFDDGSEKKLFEFLGGQSNSGSVTKTSYGIILSEKLNKILLIKKSEDDSSGLSEFLFYLNKKSKEFIYNLENNCFRPVAIPLDMNFCVDEVSTVRALEFGINTDLINAYKNRAGNTDPFNLLVFQPLSKLFGSGRNVKVSMEFSEDGDADALQLFKDVYGSFEQIQGENIEKMFTQLKLLYEKSDGIQPPEVNFKRNKIVEYIPSQDEVSEDAHILEAFIYASQKINDLNSIQSSGAP